MHRQSTDEVTVVLLHADAVGDQHHRQKANAPGEDQAVNEDDEGGFLEVGQLGRFDFPVDLGQRLLAAHRQDGVPEGNEQTEQADQAQPVFTVHTAQLLGQRRFAQEAGRVYDRCRRRILRGVVDLRPQIDFAKHTRFRSFDPERDAAPGKHDHSHHRGGDHDLERLFAGLMNPNNVLAEEVQGDRGGEEDRAPLGHGILRCFVDVASGGVA